MSKKKLPTPEELHEMLTYDPKTGLFTWKHRPLKFFKDRGDQARWNTRMAGKPAFTADDSYGYKMGRLFDRPVKAHRVAWAMTTGKWPSKHMDHINSKRSDNRIENLREVTPAENQRNQKKRRNNISGHTGVYRNCNKWVASIRINYKTINLGRYVDIEDAIAARKAAEVEYGFHPEHGRKED